MQTYLCRAAVDDTLPFTWSFSNRTEMNTAKCVNFGIIDSTIYKDKYTKPHVLKSRIISQDTAVCYLRKCQCCICIEWL